jgi:hypothetical protein
MPQDDVIVTSRRQSLHRPLAAWSRVVVGPLCAAQYARQELNLQPLAPEAPKSDSQKAA